MIGFDIKVKLVKSKGVVKFQGPASLQRQAEAVGKRAFQMIRRRITTEGVDADGRALPPLKVREQKSPDSIFNLSPDDPKFQEFLDKQPRGLKEYWSKPENQERLRSGKGRKRTSAYSEQKRRMGRAPRRDGLLTGAMWNHPMVSLTNLRDRNIVKVTFTGKSSARTDGTTSQAKLDKAGSIYNRDKARLMQYVKRTQIKSKDGSDKTGRKGGASRGVSYDTRPDFVLMALSARELGELRDDILASLSLFA